MCFVHYCTEEADVRVVIDDTQPSKTLLTITALPTIIALPTTFPAHNANEQRGDEYNHTDGKRTRPTWKGQNIGSTQHDVGNSSFVLVLTGRLDRSSTWTPEVDREVYAITKSASPLAADGQVRQQEPRLLPHWQRHLASALCG